MDNNSEKQTGLHERNGRVAWGVSVVVLALAIIGLAWYVYPRLQQRLHQQDTAIAALRSAQSAADQTRNAGAAASSSTGSLDTAERQLHDQFTKFQRGLERSTAARVADARKRAHDMSEGAFQRARALIDMQIHQVETRLARVESANTGVDSRVAELKSEIGQMRQQMAQQASELQSVRRQINNSATTETRQIADLKRSEERDRKDVDSVENSLAMHRVDFEVTEHHTSELTPGVYLHIDHTNPSLSNVDGWMRVMPEDRMFWLHRQNVQEPVIFYGANDEKQCELVLTAMRGNSVKGFLLTPEQQTSQIASARRGQ
jgi:hypothetical protein